MLDVRRRPAGRLRRPSASWEGVRLDDVDRRAVYLAEGLGHGFCALTDDATLTYLCSDTYNPTGEHAVHPLDPELGIEWPARDAASVRPRRRGAVAAAEALRRGLLPDFATAVRRASYWTRI